ncbi:MAG: hypothetical protein ABR578_05165, partial [Chromatocurvus sp.]
MAALVMLLGLAMAILGGWLLVLGGTPYYLGTGLLLLTGGVLAFLGRHTAALGVMVFALVVTIAWAVVEVGGKGWLPAWGFDLASRIGLIAALVVAAALAFLFWRASIKSQGSFASLAALAIGAAAVLVLVGANWERIEPPVALLDEPPTPRGAIALPEAGAEWTHFGGTTHGRRYSTLAEIDIGNVNALEVAWTFRSGDFTPAPGRIFYSSQNTPIKVGDSLFTCTSSSQVYALDPKTGYVRWRYDPVVPLNAMEQLFSAACRAVAYFDSGVDTPSETMPAVPGVMPSVPRTG